MEEFDCKKCLHEKVCALWASRESQNASCFCTDGCDYFTPTLTPPNEWVSVEDDMPPERDSIFKRFKGTPKWQPGFFEKISDTVNVAVEFEDGTRKTYSAHTADGEWRGLPEVGNPIVTHWMPLPAPPEKE